MVVMVGQMSFTPTGNMDPNQRRLMWLMSLVFGILFFTFPAGLVLYVFVNTSLSVAQQWVIKRGMKAPAGAEAA
jgi:YidC/Oxa1 family membrane protein insertase